MAKTDMENGYRLVPINERDHDLLGFTMEGKFFYDKVLPMGLSYSCNLFEKFSTAVHWVVEHKIRSSGCVHVLDDFLFVGPPKSESCQKTLAQFLHMAQDIGIPIKEEKTVFPTTKIIFLGLELDSAEMEIRLPDDKFLKLRKKLTYFQTRKKCTLLELQSLIGLLNFGCAVMKPGRAFLRRIIDLTLGLKRPTHRRWLTKEARADLKAWSLFIENFNGKSFFLSDIWENSEQLHLYTDASDLGFGGVFAKRWFSDQCPVSWLQYHITIRELFPIVVAIHLWGPRLQNKCVQFHTDNMALVYIINKQTSKDPTIMKWVRQLALLTLKYIIMFQALHIKGIKNIAADQLSRLQIH